MRLTPSHFTGADLGISSLSRNVALTPDTPPADSTAFFNWSAVSTSWPELWYIQTWLSIVAALRSHYPLPPCGSEESSFTLMWYLLATCWIASNVDALWEHPALSCLKYTNLRHQASLSWAASKRHRWYQELWRCLGYSFQECEQMLAFEVDPRNLLR